MNERDRLGDYTVGLHSEPKQKNSRLLTSTGVDSTQALRESMYKYRIVIFAPYFMQLPASVARRSFRLPALLPQRGSLKHGFRLAAARRRAQRRAADSKSIRRAAH